MGILVPLQGRHAAAGGQRREPEQGRGLQGDAEAGPDRVRPDGAACAGAAEHDHHGQPRRLQHLEERRLQQGQGLHQHPQHVPAGGPAPRLCAQRPHGLPGAAHCRHFKRPDSRLSVAGETEKQPDAISRLSCRVSYC